MEKKTCKQIISTGDEVSIHRDGYKLETVRLDKI
jgi:hypothetical protein